jgi:HSP20 family protein
MADQSKSTEIVNKGALASHKDKSPLVRKGEQQELGDARERRLYSPRADILETEDEFFVIADLPGVDENSVTVNLEKNILTITAHPVVEVPNGYTLTYREYIPGDYERRFVLSDAIERDKIEANVKNGVLHLHLRKVSHAQPRRITVRSG